MAFQLSPGVVVTEEDRTTIIPSVATTAGALAGAFQWGPVEQVTTVDSEINLVSQFAKPNDTTAGYFFTAANFLSYGNNLKIVRVVNGNTARNAVSTPSGIISSVTINDHTATFLTASNITVNFDSPVDSDGIIATGNVVLKPTGNVVNIIQSASGYGYNTAPTISFTSGSGSGAAATAILASGEIGAIYVTNAGNNYTTSSNIVIQNQDSTAASANLNVHFKLKDLYVANGGNNYSSLSNVQFSGNLIPGGNHAQATLVLTGNVLTGFIITDSGNGYIGAPNVIINRNTANANAGNAVITANIGYGYINKITVLNPGYGGYYFIPNVTINRNNTLGGTTAAGQARIKAGVGSIVLTSGGTGYTSNPTLTISANYNDIDFLSSNASAIGVVEYLVDSLNLINKGFGYTGFPNVTVLSGTTSISATPVVTLSPPIIKNSEDYEHNFASGGFTTGEFAAKYPGRLGNSIKVSMADSATYSTWAYKSQFTAAPGTSDYVTQRSGSSDELHIIVIDSNGEWSGVAGSVLEKFSFLSKASDAKNQDGSTNYYKDILANQSEYIWAIDHPQSTSNWGYASQGTSYNTLTANVTTTLSGGVSGDDVTVGNVLTGYNLFSNDELYDVSLLLMGPTTSVAAVNTVVGIAEARRDAVVFVSPPYADIVNTTGQADKLVTYRNQLTSSSYAVLDSGWKYQYDRYNDKYRYVALNGDIGGLAARTDYISDPWFSPAGYTRGVIKNLVKLAYSPSKADRDTLYKSGINPVVTFPGQGSLLFGDKTLLARPSAFDRINVRRLFIVLEKSIATASKFQLFEFNDAFTRGQFKNIVEPFLRDVQGRRGITDFKVVCDESNNTAAVIDRNEFVADIYIKPARSINFIQLNFIATRSGISFEEVGA
jgi:phage tail sheath protein FI